MLILCDHNPAMVRAWTAALGDEPDVEIRLGDLTEVSADAYVSAANSFGEMGGGVDLALRERFGGEIERRVMDTISEAWGRLPVGEALILETEDWDVPYLIVAPTMEVPMDVSLTDHAYLALRAVLHAWTERERREPGSIGSIAVPGLCTGVGRMDPERAAAQMRRAWEEFRQSR